MTLWLVLSVYVVGYVVAWRMVLRVDDFDPSDKTETAMALIMACMAALVWPLGLIPWALYKFAKPTTNAELRKREAEAEEQVRLRDMRIRALEQELGIRKDNL